MNCNQENLEVLAIFAPFTSDFQCVLYLSEISEVVWIMAG
jgi:hypothetical protein